MNTINIQNILFIDIETVSGEATYEDLNEDMQTLWSEKTKWQELDINCQIEFL